MISNTEYHLHLYHTGWEPIPWNIDKALHNTIQKKKRFQILFFFSSSGICINKKTCLLISIFTWNKHFLSFFLEFIGNINFTHNKSDELTVCLWMLSLSQNNYLGNFNLYFRVFSEIWHFQWPCTDNKTDWSNFVSLKSLHYNLNRSFHNISVCMLQAVEIKKTFVWLTSARLGKCFKQGYVLLYNI